MKSINLILVSISTIALLFLLIWAAYEVPIWLADHGPTAADRPVVDSSIHQDLVIRHRETVLKGIAGLIAIFVFLVAWYRSRASNRQAEAAIQSQINERYTNAVAQLVHESPEIRLGGICSLEQIMHDSEDLYWKVVKVLVEYIQIRAPGTNQKKNSISIDSRNHADKLNDKHSHASPEKTKVLVKPAQDVQAALSALVHRSPKRKEGFVIQIQAVNLEGANFSRLDGKQANLTNIFISDSNLQNASFINTDLNNAQFSSVQLQDAIFDGSSLKSTRFIDVNLHGARFRKTDLRSAHFLDAHLRDVLFNGATLKETSFLKVNLQGCDFTDAQLFHAMIIQAKMQSSNLTRANLSKASISNVDLTRSDLELTNLKQTSFVETNFKAVENLTLEQLSKTDKMINLEFSRNLKIAIQETYPNLLVKSNQDHKIEFNFSIILR